MHGHLLYQTHAHAGDEDSEFHARDWRWSENRLLACAVGGNAVRHLLRVLRLRVCVGVDDTMTLLTRMLSLNCSVSC
jgi:hypothetical protein